MEIVMKRAQFIKFPIILGIAAAVAFSVITTGTSQAKPQVSAAGLATLTPLNPAAVPKYGTFWLLQGPNHDHKSPPLPWPPGRLARLSNLPNRKWPVCG